MTPLPPRPNARADIQTILRILQCEPLELEEALTGYIDNMDPFPEQYMRMRQYPGGPFHLYDPTKHCIICATLMKGDVEKRLAAFLHDVGKADTRTVDEDGGAHYYKHDEVGADIALAWFKSFGPDEHAALNNWIDAGIFAVRVVGWIRWHMFDMEHLHTKMLDRWLDTFGIEWIDVLFDLRRADWSAARTELCDFDLIEKARTTALAYVRTRDAERQRDEAMRKDGKAPTLKDLAVNGTALITELGMEKGPAVGLALHYLKKEVNEGTLTNNPETLLAAVRRWIDQTVVKP